MKIEISKKSVALTAAVVAVVAVLIFGFWKVAAVASYAFATLLAYQMGRIALSSQEDFESERVAEEICDFYKMSANSFANSVLCMGGLSIIASIALFIEDVGVIGAPVYAFAVLFITFMIRVFSSEN